MADLRTTANRAYTNVPRGVGGYESGWSEVFVDPSSPVPSEYHDYAADTGSSGASAPETTGRLSSEGSANVLSSVALGTPRPSAPEVEILNPQYQDPGYSGTRPWGPANYPVSDYSWAGSWASQLAKAGTTKGVSAPAAAGAPYARIQETQTVFPAGAKAPVFTPPAYDEREIKKRARKLSAPGRAALEMKVHTALSRYYENPNVRRMALRDTLAGYGIGLANIVGQAEQTATQQYGAEHARLYNESMQAYNVAMQQYMSQARQVTAQKTVSTQAAYDKIFEQY